MTVLKLKGRIDEQHRLWVVVPENVSPGPVDVMVWVDASDEDDAGQNWSAGVAREWATELADSREDIYSLTDGKATDEPR